MDANSQYNFIDWYLDESCTISVGTLSTYNINQYLDCETATITLFAKYGQSFIVSFDSKQSGITISEKSTVAEGQFFNPYNVASVKTTITSWDTDVTKPQYFTGWYTDSDCTNRVSESTGVKITSETTLYAGWGSKGKINITKTPSAVTYKILINGVDVTSNANIYAMKDDQISVSAVYKKSASFTAAKARVVITIKDSTNNQLIKTDSGLVTVNAGLTNWFPEAEAKTEASINMPETDISITITGSSS